MSTTPTVRILAEPSLNQHEIDDFLDEIGVDWKPSDDNAPHTITEVAGRVCYMSFGNPRPGGNAAYLQHIKEAGHGSVLEHANWTFLFTGVSRSLTHELVRHRAGWAYSQFSQRYVDESDADYIEPQIIADDPELHDIWQSAIGRAHDAYVELAELLTAKISAESQTERRKMARQAARSVLPNATETKIVATANARAIRHFLEQRGSRHADHEIRRLANLICVEMQFRYPNLFGDYTRTPLPDGTFEITTPYRKV